MSIRFCKNNIANGVLNPPPSKSLLHRSIICSALADGKSKISNINLCDDVKATIDCVKTLGANVDFNDNSLIITGIGHNYKKMNHCNFNCNDSASTLRFIIPLSTFFCEHASFHCAKSLITRPVSAYESCGIKLSHDYEKSAIDVLGALSPNDYFIDSSQSSQFISGLLFLLPILKSSSKIITNNNLVSTAYIDMTINMLKKFGINIVKSEYGYYIDGNQKYHNCDYIVEGDYSQASFFLIAGAISGKVTCNNLNLNSIQGDKYILNLLTDIGCDIKISNDHIIVSKTTSLKPFIFDCNICPDLALPLAVLAGLCKGESVFMNTNRLKIKESNRQKAIVTLLNAIGAKVVLKDGIIYIKGTSQFKGASINSGNDHRVAMSAAIASFACNGEILLNNENAVTKSYANFFNDFKHIGGNFNVE